MGSSARVSRSGLLLSYLIVTRGVHLLSLSNSILTPGIAILVVFMFYTLFHDYGWEVIAAAPPLDPGPNPTTNYVIAIELGIASGVSWWGGVGFLARNTRSPAQRDLSPRSSSSDFPAPSRAASDCFPRWSCSPTIPTEWMVPLGGVVMGLFALVFVAAANVTSTAVSLFASGLAMRHVKQFRSMPWRQVMLLLIVPLCSVRVLAGRTLQLRRRISRLQRHHVCADFGHPLRRLLLSAQAEAEPSRPLRRRSPAASTTSTAVSIGWRSDRYCSGRSSTSSCTTRSAAKSHELSRFIPASVAASVLPALVYGIGYGPAQST